MAMAAKMRIVFHFLSPLTLNICFFRSKKSVVQCAFLIPPFLVSPSHRWTTRSIPCTFISDSAKAQAVSNSCGVLAMIV